MLRPIPLLTSHTTKSDPCWELLSWLITASTTRNPLSFQTSTLPLNPLPNGPDVSMPSETNNNVDPAGLSLDQKLYQTDSVLPQMEPSTLSSHLKTWLNVTRPTSDAMVVTSQLNGPTLKEMVSVLMLVSHTPQVVENPLLALTNALMVQPRPDTPAPKTQLLKPQLLLVFNQKYKQTDPWKLDSQYMLTS